MNRRLATLAAALALGSAMAAAAPAMAQTPAVDAARRGGIVGERFDGYIGIAGQASAGLRSQVGTINIRRRALYSNLAASRGVSPEEVGITAGCQLLARVQVGEAHMLPDRQWRRRLPGQPPPRPDYCR
jgi:uncharacterized protein YdbL (DUF1318 family)